jgi:hypothetical protein
LEIAPPAAAGHSEPLVEERGRREGMNVFVALTIALMMSVLMPTATAPAGTPAAVRYIDDEMVSAAMEKADRSCRIPV